MRPPRASLAKAETESKTRRLAGWPARSAPAAIAQSPSGSRIPAGLGAVVDDIDATALTSEQAAQILDAVRAHGVVVLKGQNLTRSQQVAFTAALGEVVVLPPSFEGKDPEPLHPEIQRVTNYFANGTWKGPQTNFGAYWHQDGQFWLPPKHRVLSVLHARRARGGDAVILHVKPRSCFVEHEWCL